ncbi:hypothetical protein C1637_09950 [Chryseobacterium lactis]|uniref:FecR protein domain-containing protein n=2 Tax=Chryseobacterium lactis TaxID=1241981 RepID=A0A3G6REN6_CHRLC|nr:hypothetical protein EG342_09750 [Chryseobacterium lactis]AZB02548.1 hypothetical protein EG341_00605 [Chryseobacterium lactis]PNW14157.1 hypothetical protein C1637_09950 [Chryseobacterium lactis]
MTFEELKYLIIDSQRKIEINKLFFLFVKAQSYIDILRIVKSEGNYRWIFNNGFRDLIQYFPVDDLESEGFYNREVTLSDMNTDIILLENGTLNLTQNNSSRCRVITYAARAYITLNNTSMVEIESNRRSVISVTANSWAYAYLTARDTSQTTLNGNDKSTFMFNGWGNSYTTSNLQPESYVNAVLNDSAKIITNTQNINARNNDKSQIIS